MGSSRAQQEGRILLAIRALDDGLIGSAYEAAGVYDVPYETLRRRRSGTRSRIETRPNCLKLTDQEEDVLVQWVLDIDSRGYAPRVAELRRKANMLLAECVRGTDEPPLTVGMNWTTRFIRRRPELSAKYLRKYDYQRALCENPKTMGDWFRLVQNVKQKYGILDEDTYKFDETGFQMGVIATAKVVTGSERRSIPLKRQPGNREWVTVIETVAADGRSIDPLIIFAGKVHQTSWFRALQHHDYKRWNIAVSPNGWTNDEIGFDWLEWFEATTRDGTVGAYRLLILDGHHSHNTPEFDQYCTDHKIVALFLPSHSSHLLQPLDVGCFSPLKQEYGKAVEELMRLGQHHVDKSEFVELYIGARQCALTNNNIRAGFKAAGLIPFDPSAVLDMIVGPVRTPTPQPLPSSQDPEQGWVPETPHNISQIHAQTQTIRKNFKRKTIHTPSPTNIATIQMAKAAEHTMYAFRLAQERIAELEAQLQKVTKRRKIKRTYIRSTGLVAAGDVELQQEEEPEGVDDDTIVTASTVAQRRCRQCNEPGHTSRTWQRQ